MGVFDFLGNGRANEAQKVLESSGAQKVLAVIFMSSVMGFLSTAISNFPVLKDVYAMITEDAGIEGIDDVADFIQLLHELGVVGETADMIADRLQAAKALKKQWIMRRR